ncbi:MAG TPA: DUF899 domain-containing protein [Acidimicrobiales bacterium]|nr:DUF899 domain-containing protein [Acidimicrobiales bacterium]
MTEHQTGTTAQWRAARLELLAAEKELTRRGDELARRRQQLPWVPVEKEYVFDTDDGEKTLRQFEGRSQLLVYHFMFGPEWTEGCPACSFWADSFDGAIVHLNNRDVTMLCASRAPLVQLNAYKGRMGWSFQWVSSMRSDFNYDFGVSFPDDRPGPGAKHNFTAEPQGEEHAGLSAFALENSVVHHTYSCYARGLEAFNAGYQLLDRAPKGRDEDDLPNTIAWLRRHDDYDETPLAAAT